ncbi:FimV/HubP family polar landmark protein [Paraburkholderia sp. IW21]|uniref:FimV/HubP family polar landmark protein n=1 Tax=Paraburkholderia sp. IW21 TaxID=3242488 RepID=UPI003522432B
MNLRLSPLRAMTIYQGTGRLAVAAALAFALAGAGVSSAVAAPGDAASAAEGASVSSAAGGQFTVRPGQSLNDVAIAVTQSHDRATLARASRALFDANPNAFMSHDPNRMRVGALLTVPVLDASGALAASEPVAGSASTASAAAAPTPNAAMAVSAASGVAQVNAAAASAASATAHAAAPATPAVSGTAGSTAQASPGVPGSTAMTGALSSAPVAGSQAGGVPASGAHAWSGSIEPSASEAAEGMSAPAAATAPATAAAQQASQPHTQVSSLQQLLALKNRVLMELQKHGIGGLPAATGTASTNRAQPPVGASFAAAVPSHGSAAISTSNDAGISQTNLSVAAAIGAALVVLLAALRLLRRKRVGVARAEDAPTDDAAVASARVTGPRDVVSTDEPVPVREASGANEEAAARYAALAAAEREAAANEAAAREVAERVAAEREAEIRRAAAEQAAERAATDPLTAEREAAARQSHTAFPAQDLNVSQQAGQEGHAASAPFEFSQPNPDIAPAAHSGFTSEPLPAAPHENLDGATTAASLAAAAELGAEALPLTPLDPVNETFPQEVPAHRLQWDDEPASSASAAPLEEPPSEPQHHLDTPPPVIDFTQQHVEPHTTSPLGQPYSDTSAHPVPDTSASAVPMAEQDADPVAPTYQPSHEPYSRTETATPDGALKVEPAPVAHIQPAPTVPAEFPRDAVNAFGSLDMPLPPRVESTADPVSTPASLSTQPVASPETTAQQAIEPYDPDDTPHIADEIAAGTAGHAAVAGLGAAGFGALKLDFDLELPPSPAQPLPAFTQADLTRIARNKLDLAAEYIDLGDLSGARTLINEVIEANDPATRTEARALLSTLAPLS